MKQQLLTGRDTFHLEIPADENNLSEVRDFISDICARAGFSKRETNNTKLAMDEACTNIIKHAYKDISGSIRIDVQAEPGNVEINIFDRGEPFEWSKIKDPDLQRYVEIGKKGGLGIYLMNRLMDSLDYQSTDAGNRLFMSKSADLGRKSAESSFASFRQPWTKTLRFKFALRATIGLFGLVLFLGVVQYINQTREIESLRNQAWYGMTNFARTLETKSENALVIDDFYDPKYREINDFIQDKIRSLPAVKYIKIVNAEGKIVSSSDIEEFQENYEPPEGAAGMGSKGVWIALRDANWGDIRELHYPVYLSEDEAAKPVLLGRVVLGVSKSEIENTIHDERHRTILILSGIFLVGVLLIYFLISVFVKPIQALTEGVRAMGEGALEDGIQISGPEEIGAIAEAFNEITMKFRHAQKSVVEQERMQKEMQVAQEIQHSLLPSVVPEISGYDIASLYRAAKEVGGDYYDFVNVDDETLGVVVADVSGKGVPGSLVMTMIRTALRMEARGSLSAADVMSRMNDFVTEDMKKGMFVTIFYVILDSKNRIISYASAGHNPMILFRAETDETFFLNPRGFPVGISLPDDTLFRRSIDVEKIKLKKDDMLVIYTDGVTEAMNEAREQYGEERLISLIKRHGRLTPEEFIEKLNDDIRGFTGGYPQNDDITVVAIKEKLMADDVLFGIRKKLLDLVDVDGLSVAEACQKMKVSPSTYYRYRKRLAELGERGLKNKMLRQEHEIKRVSLEQRKRILEIIRETPKYGAKRIAAIFNAGKAENAMLTSSLVYDELKRMRLNTYEKRLEYLRRNKLISEEVFQEMMASPSSRAAAVPDHEEDLTVPSAPGEEEGVTLQPEGALFPESGDVGRDEKADDVHAAGPQPVEPPHVTVSRIEEGARRRPAEEPVERQLERVLGREDESKRMVRIESEEHGEGVVVLRVRGHLDSSSAGELEEVLESVYEYGYHKIIVGLEDVSYISSGGWGIFTGRVKTLREGMGDVVLAGMSPEVFDIYELLGFQDIIMHFQKVEEAVEFISLPFAERQKRLEERTRAREKEEVLEHRVSASDIGSVIEEDEEQSPWTPLTIEAGTVGRTGEITVLNLAGVIDTVSCIKLKTVMNSLVDQGSIKLVVDMSRVEYVSSAGWGVFASRLDDLRGMGGDIKIFGMDPEVDGIFHLLGFDVIMRSFSILAEAIDDFDTRETASKARGEAGGSKPAVTESAERISNAGKAPAAGEAEPERSMNFRYSRIETSVKGSMVLKVGGAIDAATTVEFENQLDLCMNESPAYFVIDLEDIVYISSSGWGVIVKYLQSLGDRSCKMALAGMGPAIFKIFRDLGFEPLIPHYLTVRKALEQLSSTGEERSVKGGSRGADAATTGLPAGRTAFPDLDGIGVKPLEVGPMEDIEELKVKLDLEAEGEAADDKDRRLREIGWAEYGNKLGRKNDTDKNGKN